MALTKITGQVINDTTGLVVGVTTVGGGVSAVDGFFSGIVTFSNDVSIAGTLTYEDVTNIDAVGLVTARNGVVVGSGITLSKDGDIFATGVTTSTTFVGNLTGAATQVTVADESSDTSCNVLFTTDATGNLAPKSGTNLTFNSSSGALTATSFVGDGTNLTNVGVDTTAVFPDKISLGDGGSTDGDQICVGVGSDLKIYHANGNTSSYVSHENGSGNLFLEGDSIQLRTRAATDNDIYLSCSQGGAVGLYYNDVKTFETIEEGAKIISNGSSHGLYIYHSNGNEVARLSHGGSGDEGALILRDSGTTTVLLAGENGQNGYIAGPNSFFFGTTAGAVNENNRGIKVSSTTSGNPVFMVTSSSHYTGGAYSHYRFYDDHGLVGYINTDGDGTASYNSASDYRLKENVVPITDGITKLKTLKPYRFNFKNADASKVVQGFFAHEVSEAVPNAVKGTKDEMKSLYYEEGDTIPDGKAVGDFKEYSTTEMNPQGLDHAKMVPLLTAALQEAVAKIEVLEAKVAALEG